MINKKQPHADHDQDLSFAIFWQKLSNQQTLYRFIDESFRAETLVKFIPKIHYFELKLPSYKYAPNTFGLYSKLYDWFATISTN